MFQFVFGYEVLQSFVKYVPVCVWLRSVAKLREVCSSLCWLRSVALRVEDRGLHVGSGDGGGLGL